MLRTIAMMNRNARTVAVTFHAFCFCRCLSIKPRSTPRVAWTVRLVRRAYHITVGVRTIIRTNVSQAAVGTCSKGDVAPMVCRDATISTCAANGSPHPGNNTRIRRNITGAHLKMPDWHSGSSMLPVWIQTSGKVTCGPQRTHSLDTMNSVSGDRVTFCGPFSGGR